MVCFLVAALLPEQISQNREEMASHGLVTEELRLYNFYDQHQSTNKFAKVKPLISLLDKHE